MLPKHVYYHYTTPSYENNLYAKTLRRTNQCRLFSQFVAELAASSARLKRYNVPCRQKVHPQSCPAQLFSGCKSIHDTRISLRLSFCRRANQLTFSAYAFVPTHDDDPILILDHVYSLALHLAVSYSYAFVDP